MKPVCLGDALRDDPQITEETEQETARVDVGNHMCLSCSHERVCAVAGAIRNLLQTFNDMVISQCGAYDAAEPAITDEDLAELGSESDDGRSE